MSPEDLEVLAEIKSEVQSLKNMALDVITGLNATLKLISELEPIEDKSAHREAAHA